MRNYVSMQALGSSLPFKSTAVSTGSWGSVETKFIWDLVYNSSHWWI